MAHKQTTIIRTVFAGAANFAGLVLFHAAQSDDPKTVGTPGPMSVVNRADGDDDEAQLQQQLQADQQMQQAGQQAEEQEQLDLQQAQQDEQQGLQVEQQATLSVPGS